MEITEARYSGILFHITSIQTEYGIGDMGQNAYRFVDKLALTGATLWQILPLGPTGYGNSPYAARSTFAGNELLIDLKELAQEGYLTKEDIAFPPAFPEGHVDFDAVRAYKLPLHGHSLVPSRSRICMRPSGYVAPSHGICSGRPPSSSRAGSPVCLCLRSV